MDDELKRRIAASLDRAGEGKPDPRLAEDLERSAEARAYRAELRSVDRALRAWPGAERSAAAWEDFAARIEARLGEDVDRPGRAPDWDPMQPPELGDEPARAVQSEQSAMSQPKDDENDDDLEGLAALTRTSQAPTSMSIPPPAVKPGPSLTEDGLDDSSGIVDLQKMAKELPRTPAATAEEKPAAKPAAEEKPRAAASAPAPNAAAEAKAESAKPTRPAAEPAPAKRTSPVIWMLPVAAAAAVGGFFALKSNTAQQAMAPSTAQPAGAPAENAAPAAPPPPVAQAQPTAAPASPTAMVQQAQQPAADQAANAPTVAAPAAPEQPAAAAHAAPADDDQARTQRAREQQEAARTRGGAEPADQPAARRETAAAPAAEPAPAPAAAAPARTSTTSTTTASAPPPTAPAASGSAGGQPTNMNDLMVRAMGGRGPGATNTGAGGAAAAAPAQTLPETPSRSQVTGALAPLSPAVRACAQGQTGTATVALVIANNGSVQNVSVMGPFSGDVKACIQSQVRRAHFPQFTRPTVSLVYPFTILPPRPGASQ